MRLICPNCGAQYEVDEQVIPETGRDVQCSNCGHTWFQRPAHLDEELADELDEDLPLTDATRADPAATEPAETADAPAPETAGPEPEEDPKPAPDTESEPRRRRLDPSVTDVLREEAAREAEARRGDRSGLETQPDLGLDDAETVAAQRSAAARARMKRLRGLEDDTPEDPDATTARRDLLPDIDEINSTLRAEQDRNGDDDAAADPVAETEKTGRRGFRRGFFLIVLLAAAAIALYAFAPQIVQYVPAAEPYMVQYVDWANGMREVVNGAVDAGIAQVQKLIGGVTGGE